MTTIGQAAAAPVHVLADMSNLIGGARGLANLRGERGVRLEAANLLAVLANGRVVASARAVINEGVGDLALARFERAGWMLDVVEPGRTSGREQFADQALQARLFELLRRVPRSTFVLATGDGAGHAEGHGFLPYLDVAVRAEARPEVASWTFGLNPSLARWACTRAQLRVLDPCYPYATFVEGGRPALPVPPFLGRAA